MSEAIKRILEAAPRIVRSVASPGYWHTAGEVKDPTKRLAITEAEAALITSTIAAAELEIRQRELHHFETEQENASLHESVARWQERCVEAQRERDALRAGRTPDQHLRDQIRHLEAHVAELQEQVRSLEAGADEY